MAIFCGFFGQGHFFIFVFVYIPSGCGGLCEDPLGALQSFPQGFPSPSPFVPASSILGISDASPHLQVRVPRSR